MAKIKGTVKWFSNRKGFGFIAPTSDNAPTSDEIFVHHSALIMVEGAYRTLAENAEVEFETETDPNGKLKAVNVTNADGSPLVPPPREKRRPRKPRTENGGEHHQAAGAPAAAETGTNAKVKSPREPPFHDVIAEDTKAKIADKGLKLVRNTVDLALGESRIKLGQGGYASLVDASCLVGEGTFTCDEAGKVVFTWERCLELKDGNWVPGDVSKLMPSLCMAEDAVEPVKPDETPETLWGADKPDPKDVFTENGFKMKKVILARPRGGRGRKGGE